MTYGLVIAPAVEASSGGASNSNGRGSSKSSKSNLNTWERLLIRHKENKENKDCATTFCKAMHEYSRGAKGPRETRLFLEDMRAASRVLGVEDQAQKCMCALRRCKTGWDVHVVVRLFPWLALML